MSIYDFAGISHIPVVANSDKRSQRSPVHEVQPHVAGVRALKEDVI